MTLSAPGWRVGISIGSAATVAMLRAPGMRPRPILAGGSPRLPSSADPVYPGHRDPMGAGSMLPQHLARIAAEVHRAAGRELVDTTVGCPPEWEPTRRAALAEAVTRAGLSGAEVVGEATAAAACLVDADDAAVAPGGLLLVFDAGASSCDVSLLRRTVDGFETVAFETVQDCGGIRFDTGLVEFIGARIAAGDRAVWHRLLDPLTPVDRAARLRLWEEVRALKHRLSGQTEATLTVPLAGTGLTVTRDEFEALARPVLGRALRATRDVLGPAGVSAVLLVGGSTRIPLIGRLLAEVTGREPVTVKDPDLVVAEGCALLPRRPAPLIDDDVQFTVHRPLRVPPHRWEPMLVFAHRPGSAEQVRARAERLSGEDHTPSPRTAGARASVSRGPQIRVVPDLPGVECHPREHVLDRPEPVHEMAFRLRASPTAPEVVRGFVRVWCGPVVIGEVSLTLPVALGDVRAERRPEPIRRYRRIFPSYSNHDRAVAEALAIAARALGDQYLQDVVTLRSAQEGSPRLLELIEEADVFQLFWSNNSMISEYCRAEWECALRLGRPSFVRPLHWEDPLPEAPPRGLPPAELRRLHFARVPVASAAPAEPPRSTAPAPAPAAPGAPTWSRPPPVAPRSPAPAPVPAPAAFLRVVPAGGAATTFPLPRQRATVIGTGIGSDLRLTDAYASRRHAEITPSGERFLVDDLGSTNGTTLNGHRVNGREPLRPGDVLGVGRTRLELAGSTGAVPPSPGAPEPAGAASAPARVSAGLITTGAALAVAGVGWWLLSPYAGTVVGLCATIAGLILGGAGTRRRA